MSGRLEKIWPRKPLQRALLTGLILFAGGLSAGAWSLLGREKGLDIFWSVPDFSLVERSGRKVGRADLAGKVWVANFIYTHCPDTCPLQTGEMARLQEDLAGEEDVRLVSITVDPERDTPEVLSRYAEKFGAHPERWLFLTGEKGAIYRLAQEGFRLSVVDPREGVRDYKRTSGGAGGLPLSLLRLVQPPSAWAHHPGPFQPFIHSSRFVLVDRKAHIRGHYGVIISPSVQAQTQSSADLYDQEALSRLRRDIRILLREGS